MVTRTFSELVGDLKQRREVGDPPPAVLLGAGASVESGVGAMTDLFAFVRCANFEEFVRYIDPMTPPERYRLLARFLQSREPAEPTAGYRALAALCADAYFDLILTTNLDPLLDDSLAHARLWRRDYLLVVNGVVRPERVDPVLTARSPRVKVVKLHGDLFHRFMAWTPAEMNLLVDEISEQLEPALHGRDFLVVGHSLRDERIRDLVVGAGGAIWYLNVSPVPDFLAGNQRLRAVIGPESTFEKVFTGLVEGLGVTMSPGEPGFGVMRAPLPSRPSRGPWTIDDFMGSVVALGGPVGGPSFTGFVLREPRVIVTDGYAASMAGIRDRAAVFVAGKRAVEVKARRRKRSHPFDPVILEAPEALAAPGLVLDAGAPEAGLEVRVAVAAGDRIGVSSGVIEDPAERSIEISPIGSVAGMVEINCVVAPGACGAPVVDPTLAVRGFIVAGAEERPPSIMYPATRWAQLLRSRRGTRSR